MVATAINANVVIDGRNGSVFVGTHGHGHLHGVAAVMAVEDFLTGVQNLDRSSGLPGQRGGAEELQIERFGLFRRRRRVRLNHANL